VIWSVRRYLLLLEFTQLAILRINHHELDGIDQRLLYPLYIATTVTHHMHLSIITGRSKTREKARLLFYINHLHMNRMIPIFYIP